MQAYKGCADVFNTILRIRIAESTKHEVRQKYEGGGMQHLLFPQNMIDYFCLDTFDYI